MCKTCASTCDARMWPLMTDMDGNISKKGNIEPSPMFALKDFITQKPYHSMCYCLKIRHKLNIKRWSKILKNVRTENEIEEKRR